MSYERLETRLLNEASRTASKFKTVKGGSNKTNFDNKVKNITVLQEELQQLQPLTLGTPSTPVQAPGDITLPWDLYHSTEQFRTIHEIKQCAKNAKPVYGVKNAQLLDMEPVRYVPDELHLLMRVMWMSFSETSSLTKSKDDYGKIIWQSTDNVSVLVKAVQSCGVCFKTWVSKTGELDWTSLSGNDIKKVLKHLPD